MLALVLASGAVAANAGAADAAVAQPRQPSPAISRNHNETVLVPS
ncbi:hypothetical protein AB0B45_06135 [Nonomuraea sp. NPDC049152]